MPLHMSWVTMILTPLMGAAASLIAFRTLGRRALPRYRKVPRYLLLAVTCVFGLAFAGVLSLVAPDLFWEREEIFLFAVGQGIGMELAMRSARTEAPRRGTSGSG